MLTRSRVTQPRYVQQRRQHLSWAGDSQKTRTNHRQWWESVLVLACARRYRYYQYVVLVIDCLLVVLICSLTKHRLVFLISFAAGFFWALL